MLFIVDYHIKFAWFIMTVSFFINICRNTIIVCFVIKLKKGYLKKLYILY
jgi:hypothetical protein